MAIHPGLRPRLLVGRRIPVPPNSANKIGGSATEAVDCCNDADRQAAGAPRRQLPQHQDRPRVDGDLGREWRNEYAPPVGFHVRVLRRDVEAPFLEASLDDLVGRRPVALFLLLRLGLVAGESPGRVGEHPGAVVIEDREQLMKIFADAWVATLKEPEFVPDSLQEEEIREGVRSERREPDFVHALDLQSATKEGAMRRLVYHEMNRCMDIVSDDIAQAVPGSW
jgi:hypothetical protein